MEAGGAHLDVLVLREEEEHPGAGGGRRVLSGEQQTNQHAGDLVISHVTPTPAQRSPTVRVRCYGRRVLPGEPIGDLVISHVTPTPARRSQLWRLISQSRYLPSQLTYHRNSKTIIAIVLRQCDHCRDTIVILS